MAESGSRAFFPEQCSLLLPGRDGRKRSSYAHRVVLVTMSSLLGVMQCLGQLPGAREISRVPLGGVFLGLHLWEVKEAMIGWIEKLGYKLGAHSHLRERRGCLRASWDPRDINLL